MKEKSGKRIEKVHKWSKKKRWNKNRMEKRNEVFLDWFFVRKLKGEKDFKRNFKKSFEIKDDYLNTVCFGKNRKRNRQKEKKRKMFIQVVGKNPTSLWIHQNRRIKKETPIFRKKNEKENRKG